MSIQRTIIHQQKEMCNDTCYTWVDLKTCYVKEASHKELHTSHDSIYMKCAEKANLEKAGQWFPGPWGGENGD